MEHCGERYRATMTPPGVTSRIAALATAAVLLFAGAVSATAVSPTALGTISGAVTDTGDNPLSGIVVQAVGSDPTNMAVAFSMLGSYTIVGLQPDTYHVRTMTVAEDYIDEWYHNVPVDGASPPQEATALVINGDSKTDIDFKLAAAASLTGAVDSEAGAPLKDAIVLLYDSRGRQVTAGWVDASGTYTLTGLQSGTYALLAEGAHVNHLAEWYDDVPRSGSAVPSTAERISLASGETRSGLNFVLTQAAGSRERLGMTTVSPWNELRSTCSILPQTGYAARRQTSTASTASGRLAPGTATW